MFYAHFVLSKKGPLAKIWLAAHWEKKLSKAQIYETNVQDAVDEILKPKVKIALRTTGHLLLGIVRIYSRQTKYLLADCNEAFLKIKMAFRPGQALIKDDSGSDAQHLNAITLPEVYADFDTSLQDFDDFEITDHLQMDQSRIDEITIREDIADQMHGMYLDKDSGLDDFGEKACGAHFNIMENFGEDDTMIDTQLRDNRFSLENWRDASAASIVEIERSNRILREENLSKMTTNEDDVDFMDVGKNEDFGHYSVMDNMYMEAPGAEMMTYHPQGAQMDQSVSLMLEPLDMTAFDNGGRIDKKRKKQRLIVDDEKNISAEEMKQNMADYTDTLQELEIAPPTRKLMKMKEMGHVEKLLNLPGCSFLRAKPLLEIFQSHLIVRPCYADHRDEIRKEMELSDFEDDDESAFYGENFEDDPFPQESFGDEVPFPMADLDSMPEDFSPEKKEGRSGSPDRKKRKLNDSQKRTIIDGEAANGDEDNRWTRRTQRVLNSISAKLKNSDDDKIAFSDLLTKGATRKVAAKKFYSLLVLKKNQAIDVAQAEPYGEISISAGPNIGEPMPH